MSFAGFSKLGEVGIYFVSADKLPGESSHSDSRVLSCNNSPISCTSQYRQRYKVTSLCDDFGRL